MTKNNRAWEARKAVLNKKIKAAKAGGFQLPDSIKVTKIMIGHHFAYEIRDEVLGVLGRMHVLSAPGNKTELKTEVLNDGDEVMMAARKGLLTPVVEMLTEKMQAILGS
jgi:hypothetical protein